MRKPEEAEDVAGEQRDASAVRFDELGRPRRDQNHEERRRDDRGTGLEARVAQHVLQVLLPDEHRAHQRAEDDDARDRRDPEDATRRDVEVVEGYRGPLLPDEERDAGDDRHCREAHDDFGLVRHRREVDREDQAPDHQRGQHTTEVVDRLGRLVHMARHEEDREEQRDSSERQRDEEHRAPPEVLQEGARHERTERGDRAAERRPQRDRLGASGARPERGDQRERRRVSHAGRDAADDAGTDEDADRTRPRGGEARRDRQHHAEDQHHLAAIPVAERAEPQHRRGEPERVADGDQVERGLRRVERLPDVGQRDVGDREVQVRDRGHEDERQEHEGRSARRGRSFCGRGVGHRAGM